jgi:hypothetical protein
VGHLDFRDADDDSAGSRPTSESRAGADLLLLLTSPSSSFPFPFPFRARRALREARFRWMLFRFLNCWYATSPSLNSSSRMLSSEEEDGSGDSSRSCIRCFL